MEKLGLNRLHKNYPQNYIIQRPSYGVLWSFIITFGFMLLYRPLDPNDKKILGYEGAMAAYCFLGSIAFFFIIILLKKLPYFSDKANWTLSKELLVVFICLPIMSLTIFAAGFLIEIGGNPRLFDAIKSTFLVGILPFVVFSLRNFSYWAADNKTFIKPNTHENESRKPTEEKIHIESKLKNESLSFDPGQFLFAESEGNYVTFYFAVDNKIEKTVIRNSISNIENQLASIDFFFRTHRAFIVNLHKVREKSGNVLGYRLKLKDIDSEIPVSRQNTKRFNERLKQVSTSS